MIQLIAYEYLCQGPESRASNVSRLLVCVYGPKTTLNELKRVVSNGMESLCVA